ncbi:MAG: hypothetical protein AELANPGJ_03010 [Anaerolineae bacterium]|nr:hypothetical protein [Anaerolineae bacterium]
MRLIVVGPTRHTNMSLACQCMEATSTLDSVLRLMMPKCGGGTGARGVRLGVIR